MSTTKVCNYCGKTFQARGKNGKYCQECWAIPMPKPCQDGNCNCGKLVYTRFKYYAKGCPNNRFGTALAKWGKYAEYKHTGIMMRSKLERDFAHDLDKFCIKWEYEPFLKGIVIDGIVRACLPDFYISKLHTYIELRPKKLIDNNLISKVKSIRNSGKRVIIVSEKNRYKLLLKLSQEYNSTVIAENINSSLLDDNPINQEDLLLFQAV